MWNTGGYTRSAQCAVNVTKQSICPPVRLCVTSIDSSSGRRRVCCWGRARAAEIHRQLLLPRDMRGAKNVGPTVGRSIILVFRRVYETHRIWGVRPLVSRARWRLQAVHTYAARCWAALVRRDVVFDDNIFEAKAKGWRRGVVVSGVRRMN